jgi:hypothetical protein
MPWSSLSSPPRGVEVSSSRQPQAATHDKSAGPSSCQVARPAREDQWTIHPRAAHGGTSASEPQRSAPHQDDPPRRSEDRPATAHQLYDGSDRPDSDSLQRLRSRARSSDSASTTSAPLMAEPSTAPRRLQSLLIRGGGAPDVHVSLIAAGGTIHLRPSRRPGSQPPSRRGNEPLPRWRQTEAKQPPSRRGRSAQPPSRARRGTR